MAAVVWAVAPVVQPQMGWLSLLVVSTVTAAIATGVTAYFMLDRAHRELDATREELQQHRALYEDFFVNANDVFYTADKHGVFQVVNPAGERVTGYRVGTDPVNLFEIVAPEYLPLVREMAARKADGTPRTAYELEIVTKDGRRLPVEVSTRLIYDEHAMEFGVQGVLRDISERRAAEQQLRESEALLSMLIENIPEGVVLLDERLRVVRANATAAEMLEGHGEVADGSLIRIGGHSTEQLLDLPPGGPSEMIEVTVPDPLVLQVSGRRIEGGAFRGGVLVIRDATMERRVAEQVQQHARLAAVGELAAGVAHDFNNLLQGIAVIAEALGSEPDLPESARTDANTIVDQASLGSRVTRQLLDFSRQSPLTRQLIDLEALLREVCPLLHRTLPSRIEFVLEVELGGGRAPVLADPALIQQMVANLVINARDAMPDGGRLEVWLGTVDPDTDERVLPDEVNEGRWVEVRVRDTGCGMSREVRERVFEPFFTTKERGAGTGLGLSQVYGIVQQHDGQIVLASEPGQGTEVSVLLPEHSQAIGENGESRSG
jgi:PAS domain S-box-containing protein